ncbi:superoxide dismutase [Desulfonatronum thioautotrophicum]|uniref:superoxide dismutase n=1 Tax=Desulfonatronum thioautotrophicum TaxID=617001 RepID=UPI0005EBE28A|nr:superoxide dismutase [Desulfonatronum thioautotrophicum]
MSTTASQTTPFVLEPLPYADNTLEPVITAQTIGYHYGKHHQTYVDKLNDLIPGTEYAGMGLEQIISIASDRDPDVAIFNNAAQVWNHNFYWKSMRRDGGGEPPVMLKQQIEASFGSVAECKKQLTKAAVSQFGSGWAWLVLEAEQLKVVKTANAGVPFTAGQIPLLTIDVWEHAYYLDYQNRRAAYVEAVLDKLVNWEFALENMG